MVIGGWRTFVQTQSIRKSLQNLQDRCFPFKLILTYIMLPVYHSNNVLASQSLVPGFKPWHGSKLVFGTKSDFRDFYKLWVGDLQAIAWKMSGIPCLSQLSLVRHNEDLRNLFELKVGANGPGLFWLNLFP